MNYILHDPINKTIGIRIRKCRVSKGLSMEQLGAELGLTYQQVQKYETAKGSISAGKVFQISKILGRSVSYFFNESVDERLLKNTKSQIDIIDDLSKITIIQRKALSSLIRTMVSENDNSN